MRIYSTLLGRIGSPEASVSKKAVTSTAGLPGHLKARQRWANTRTTRSQSEYPLDRVAHELSRF